MALVVVGGSGGVVSVIGGSGGGVVGAGSGGGGVVSVIGGSGGGVVGGGSGGCGGGCWACFCRRVYTWMAVLGLVLFVLFCHWSVRRTVC